MNEHTFNEIYAEYKVMVFRIIYAYLQNIEDTEDVVIETFVRLYQTKRSFKTKSDNKYYLIRIAINVAKTALSKPTSVPLADLVVPNEDSYNLENCAFVIISPFYFIKDYFNKA